MIAALSTLGRSITPTPENVIPPPLVTALVITGDDVPLDGGGITFLPDITPTPKDGVQTLPNRIVGRGALPPDIRRLHLGSINIAPQHRRPARVHIAPLGPSL
ncbi:hypothetical protein JQU16_22400, partial [Ponticoccus sp. SC6-60]|nr:hypothetical protein [Ponticoccus sp. SC6-60]